MQKLNSRTLFHLTNDKLDIVEIKRNGIVNEDKSKLYYWLLYDKKNDMLTHLEFSSMGTKNGNEFRAFTEGSIEFSDKKGIYTIGSKKYEMQVVDPALPLAQHLQEAIGDFILMLNLKPDL